jgi:hypothetical protein
MGPPITVLLGVEHRDRIVGKVRDIGVLGWRRRSTDYRRQQDDQCRDEASYHAHTLLGQTLDCAIHLIPNTR